MVRCLALLSALLIAMLTAPLAAQDAEATSTDSEARVRFEAGRMAFTAERYEDALVDFERAYDLSQRPVLLFNIAQSYARLGRDREALEAYRRFLLEAPEGEAGRDEAEAQIVLLERAIAEAPPEPVDEGDEPLEPPAQGDSTAGWVVLATGAATTVAGTVLAAFGLADRATVESPGAGAMWSDAMEAYERGPILEAVGFTALGVGLATLSIGVVLLLTTPGEVTSGDLASGTLRWSL